MKIPRKSQACVSAFCTVPSTHLLQNLIHDHVVIRYYSSPTAWLYGRSMHVPNPGVSQISKCISTAVQKLAYLLTISSADRKRNILRGLDKLLGPMKKSNCAKYQIWCATATRKRVHEELKEVEWPLLRFGRYMHYLDFGYYGVIQNLWVMLDGARWC
jgi:hypothetical protein